MPAAPIPTVSRPSSRPFGDVCLTIPAQRLGDGSKDRLVDALRCCVSEITKTIGSPAPSLAVG